METQLIQSTPSVPLAPGPASETARPTRHAERSSGLLAGSSRARAAVQGSAWTIIEFAAVQLLRTVATLVLARYFLSPEVFGVVGLVTVFLSGLMMFSELGIVVNIVQHPRGADPAFLNTAFSIQAARGLAIWALAAVAAYPLALFYKQPTIFPLLVVAAFSEVIRGLISTGAWSLKRQLKLRGLALLAIAAEAAGVVVAVLWAAASPTAWALVIRTLVVAVIYAGASHLLAAPKVRFAWDRSVARDILKFGGWISLSTAAYFLAGQGERLILGKFVTAAELGCFSLALVIASAPSTGLGNLVNQVFLPMISASVRTGKAETVRDFLRVRQIFFGIALLAGFGFLIFARPFVALVLNPQYQMTGWMLQALGLRVALDLFTAPASSLLLAFGQSRYAAIGNTTRMVLMVGGLAIAFAFFGIRQAVAWLVVAQVLSYFPLIFGLYRLLPEVGKTELRQYLAALVILGAAAAAAVRMGASL